MRTKGLLSIIMLLGLLFTAQAADHVKGNGKLSSKKITIDDYNSIKIDGVIDFNYEQSDAAPYIEVTVDENLHEYVNINMKISCWMAYIRTEALTGAYPWTTQTVLSR